MVFLFPKIFRLLVLTVNFLKKNTVFISSNYRQGVKLAVKKFLNAKAPSIFFCREDDTNFSSKEFLQGFIKESKINYFSITKNSIVTLHYFRKDNLAKK